MDIAARAIEAVSGHPAITNVELAGSRSRSTDSDLSDWDFAITTSDFALVARALPSLVQPLRPIAQQWEPLGNFPAYMLMLSGPTKVEYLFLDHFQEPEPPRVPSAETLQAIDDHFWDWIWWIATKDNAGRGELVRSHWPLIFEHLLQPLGANEVPDSVGSAVSAYLSHRQTLENRFRTAVSRKLEREVRAGLRRLGHAL
jgi:hypothetical protein